MRLKSSPKLPGFHRGCMPEQTLARVRPAMARVGITRLSDITGLDRIGLPVWSAVVPKSRDVLSVYNGKGATHEGARVGAIMEAFERNAGYRADPRALVWGSYNALSRTRRVMDPATVTLPLRADHTPDKEVAWVEGREVTTGEPVLVPADLVWMGTDAAWRTYALNTSNGLSAGNTYEEAVAQALCEIIERDAWTIAEVLSHWLPRARFDAARARAGLPRVAWDGAGPQPFDDDPDRYAELDPATLDGVLAQAHALFLAAGVQVTVRDVTSDTGIPTMLAMVLEDVASDLPRAHLGAGAHPDPRIAAMRALSEAVQSRVVDIQGVREDLHEAGSVVSPSQMHSKRPTKINPKYWLIRPATRRRALADVPNVRNEDTLEDVRLMLSRLRGVGLETAIEVDLTDPSLGVPVTRVIVPGAESWGVDHGKLGHRATRAWNRNRAASH